jgi:hypothetical protein
VRPTGQDEHIKEWAIFTLAEVLRNSFSLRVLHKSNIDIFKTTSMSLPPPYDPSKPSVVGVSLPRTPLCKAHMHDWKLFATEVVSREAARRDVPIAAVLDDLLLESHYAGEFALKNLAANISPKNKRFSFAFFNRILPVLLRWRWNFVDEKPDDAISIRLVLPLPQRSSVNSKIKKRDLVGAIDDDETTHLLANPTIND